MNSHLCQSTEKKLKTNYLLFEELCKKAPKAGVLSTEEDLGVVHHCPGGRSYKRANWLLQRGKGFLGHTHQFICWYHISVFFFSFLCKWVSPNIKILFPSVLWAVLTWPSPVWWTGPSVVVGWLLLCWWRCKPGEVLWPPIL